MAKIQFVDGSKSRGVGLGVGLGVGGGHQLQIVSPYWNHCHKQNKNFQSRRLTRLRNEKGQWRRPRLHCCYHIDWDISFGFGKEMERYGILVDV